LNLNAGYLYVKFNSCISFYFSWDYLIILSTTSEVIYTALFQIVLGLGLFYLNKYKDVKKVQNILRKLF
jgi:hypothetical protein